MALEAGLLGTTGGSCGCDRVAGDSGAKVCKQELMDV